MPLPPPAKTWWHMDHHYHLLDTSKHGYYLNVSKRVHDHGQTTRTCNDDKRVPQPPLAEHTTAIDRAQDTSASRASTFLYVFFLIFHLTNGYFSDCAYSTSNNGARDAYKRGPTWRQGKETIGARLRLHNEWRRPKTHFLTCLGPLVCPFYIFIW